MEKLNISQNNGNTSQIEGYNNLNEDEEEEEEEDGEEEEEEEGGDEEYGYYQNIISKEGSTL
jgi:hypothetical protein